MPVDRLRLQPVPNHALKFFRHAEIPGIGSLRCHVNCGRKIFYNFMKQETARFFLSDFFLGRDRGGIQCSVVLVRRPAYVMTIVISLATMR